MIDYSDFLIREIIKNAFSHITPPVEGLQRLLGNDELQHCPGRMRNARRVRMLTRLGCAVNIPNATLANKEQDEWLTLEDNRERIL